jgi:hypothetical protein
MVSPIVTDLTKLAQDLRRSLPATGVAETDRDYFVHMAVVPAGEVVDESKRRLL